MRVPLALKRLAIRAAYYPSLVFNRLMCALGLWNRWDWVDDHVLLGRVPTARDVVVLRQLGITGIVNMCEEFDGHTAALTEHGIEQLHVPTLDFHPPSTEDLLQAVAFIARHVRQGGKVYLHCKAGRGRSATLAVCYLMAADGVPAEEAYRRVKGARRQVDRALHCRAVVREIERQLNAQEVTIAFREAAP